MKQVFIVFLRVIKPKEPASRSVHTHVGCRFEPRALPQPLTAAEIHQRRTRLPPDREGLVLIVMRHASDPNVHLFVSFSTAHVDFWIALVWSHILKPCCTVRA